MQSVITFVDVKESFTKPERYSNITLKTKALNVFLVLLFNAMNAK